MVLVVRDNFPKGRRNTGKPDKCFKQAASVITRRNNTKENSPNPVITRWGTLLEATACYVETFETVVFGINERDGHDASSIAVLQNMFYDSNEFKVLKTDLANSYANL